MRPEGSASYTFPLRSNLLHGGKRVVWCDAGYQGVHKREENLGCEVDWQVAAV